LPTIRTSVDHGTALELAATGEASSESMKAAITEAIVCAQKQSL
jgi:4-hydroxythreonine-4-phosphate dehydrogenase